MIILRQRLYTRNDVKVLKELHQATKGFRVLPKGYKNLTARDIYRINDLSTELYQRSKGNGDVNWENLKTLATHLELPETSKHGQHAIEKFTNPELLERYRSIQAHRLGFGKEWAEATKLSNEYGALQKRYKEICKEIDCLGRKDPTKFEELIGQQEQIEWLMGDWERKNRKRYNILRDFIKVRTMPVSSTPKFNTTISRRATNLNNKALLDYENLEKATQNSQLASKVTDNIARDGIEIVRGETNQFIPDANKVMLTESGMVNPAVAGHEWNHKRFEDKLVRRKGIKQKTERSVLDLRKEQGGEGVFWSDNPLYDIPHEIAASSLYLNSPVARQATPLEKANQEKLLTKGFETYYRGTIGRLSTDLPSIPHRYNLPRIG